MHEVAARAPLCHMLLGHTSFYSPEYGSRLTVGSSALLLLLAKSGVHWYDASA
jgi:hypothetical protein